MTCSSSLPGAPVTLLELFRTLSSFDPKPTSLAGAPWETYVDWAIRDGLAPLASYNLEYRMAGGDAPQWAREQLMSVYQGSINDNVLKLVNFKRAVAPLVGRKLVLLGAAAFVEQLYPHVSFRPVIDLRVLVRPGEVEPLAGFLRRADFAPTESQADPVGARAVLSDGRTTLFLHDGFGGDKEIFERALPWRPMGSAVYRLDLEDALLVAALEQARQGFFVPKLSFIDVRELLRGAPGPLSTPRPLDAKAVVERARAWRAERALYVSLAITARLFPEVAPAAAELFPPLRKATTTLLDRVAVEPVAQVGQQTALRGLDRLRRLLAGS